MGADEDEGCISKWASTVDSFLSSKFYRVGFFVGSRPGLSVGLSTFFCLLCATGFSQVTSESRPDKLWIPQGTDAQTDQKTFENYFEGGVRFFTVLLEAKSGSILDKDKLKEAMQLHAAIEQLDYEGQKLSDICVSQPSGGHPCFVNSVLGTWGYDPAQLSADGDVLATLNAQGTPRSDFESMLGAAVFDGDAVTSAKVLKINYFNKMNKVLDGGSYTDEVGEGWEEKALDLMKCDDTVCDDDNVCACGWKSDHLEAYVLATRSRSDEFGDLIRGDIGMINGAFLLMGLFLVINLGGLCHKVKSRTLLAGMCLLTIVAAGVSGYGLCMWMQVIFTPVHQTLPFVLIGIGVDDSFVLMNALDRTDPRKEVPVRFAEALSHAGVSILVTSITDFVAFTISISSALPALSAFCQYAAFCCLMLLLFQIFMFAGLAAWDTYRVRSNRIDCCFCLTKGCPCCPVVPAEECEAAIAEGKKDPNQMLCCTEPKHPSGRVGWFLEAKFAPALVKLPVSIGVIGFFFALVALMSWQASLLSVQDTTRKFLPDDSYALSAMTREDIYFDQGTRFDIMTMPGNYFQFQAGLQRIGPELDKLAFVEPTTSMSYRSWVDGFHQACADGTISGVTMNADKSEVTNEAEYFAALKSYVSSGPGSMYKKDIVWNDDSDPSQGIAASKIQARMRSVLVDFGSVKVPDAAEAVDNMAALRDMCKDANYLPGGKCTTYTPTFLRWEVFDIIYAEMFQSVGLCLLGVAVLMLILIAHPLTAFLVFLCVTMTIVDILGMMNILGLAVDNVVVIQLVIAVGLAVDYSAHVGHSFMMQTGTRSERVTKTLASIGAAVLCGGVSTLLGVSLLGFSKSYVFRVFFVAFILTTTLGLAHGLVLLPALLNVVGPEAYFRARTSHTEEITVECKDKESE